MPAFFNSLRNYFFFLAALRSFSSAITFSATEVKERHAERLESARRRMASCFNFNYTHKKADINAGFF
jgi:hypothetical protein